MDAQERAVKYSEELEKVKESNDEITKELKSKDIVLGSREAVI